MLFTDLHRVTKTSADDWFDPILDHDTKVFIDPFLIFRKGKPPFDGAHSRIIQFFTRAFEIAARTGGKAAGLQFGKLLDLLHFPEVDQLRLGYAGKGHGGAGTADGFARLFAGAIMQSIALGIVDFRHFEEIGIFNDHIGRDRISDITANILKPFLIVYTQAVCARHNIPTKPFRMRLGFDLKTDTWEDDFVELPPNPFTDEGVLLTPKSFLRTDPTLDKEGFKEFLWEKKNHQLRNELNYAVKSDLDSKAIIAIAREHRDWLREFVQEMETDAIPTPYDLERDPKGLYRWHQVTKDFVAANPYSVHVSSDEAFGEFVNAMADRFRLWVEKKGGWKLIWDSEKPLSEEGVQHYFYGIAYHYCAANNISFLREVDTGRGPVDFYFSSGYNRRALVEAKLAKNGKFWNNIVQQLPEYMLASEIALGRYLVLCYSDHDFKKKVPRIGAALAKASEKAGYPIEVTIIDARPSKLSASRMR